MLHSIPQRGAGKTPSMQNAGHKEPSQSEHFSPRFLGSIPGRNFRFISTSADPCLWLEQVGSYSPCLLLPGARLCLLLPWHCWWGWAYSGPSPAPVRLCRGLWWDSALRKCWPEGLLGLSPQQEQVAPWEAMEILWWCHVWCWSCSVPSCPYTLPVWAGATRAQGPSSVQGWLLCSAEAGAGGSLTSRLGGWSSLLHSWAGGGVKTCGKRLAEEGPPMGMSPIVWGCPT